MKRILSSIFIVLLFVLFCMADFKRRSEVKVIKVISPDTFVADINGNGTEDIDETICVNEVTSYKFDINDIENIGFWYIANQYALSTLQDRSVKLDFTGEKSDKCRFAKVTVNNQDYGELLTKHNFNLNDIDYDKLDAQKSAIEKLNLVIYNHKSHKIHKLDCKYGKMSHDAVILPMRQVPKEGEKCKFCFEAANHKDKFKNDKKEENINIIPINYKGPKDYPSSIVDGNIKLIISDYTTKLKPDRNCDYVMCKEFVNLINSSIETIDIASYGFDNISQVREALISAQNRGVKIRVVYDVKSSGENTVYPETKDFLSFIPDENLKNDLNKDKTSANTIMHNKFAVFDGKKVFTGSMNFSSTGFSGFNSNSVIILNSQNSAKIFEAEFEQMFNGKFHRQKTVKTENNLQDYSIYFSPQDKVISDKIIPLINRAKNYIYIPIFVITHEELSQAILNAHKRGVDVKLIVDATNSKISRSKVNYLRNSNIPVKVENYAGKMHTKTIIIDDEYLITGSMNLSKSGENKNDENCIIFHNPKLAKFFKGYFEYVWSKIPDKYLTRHLKAESKESIGSCYDGVDNDFDGYIDNFDKACK